MLFLCFYFAIAQNAECGLHYKGIDEREVNIKGCIFESLSYLQHGGAVLINNQISLVNISFDSFENCSTYGDDTRGGAIYCCSNSLNLSSVCCSICSAWEGSFFCIGSNKIRKFYLSSVMASQSFKNVSKRGSSISAFGIELDFTFCNASDIFRMGKGAAITLSSDMPSNLGFCTVSNFSKFDSLFSFDGCKGSKIEMSNIIGNEGCSILYLSKDLNVTLASCVLIRNDFNFLIDTVFYSRNYSVCFMIGCWLDVSKEYLIKKEARRSSNMTFELCDFAAKNTLDFFDRYLVSDGFTCGIRFPSPTPSALPLPTVANYLNGWSIFLIVAVSAIVCTTIGSLTWFFTKKKIKSGIQKDVEMISLLRSLESSYG